MLHKSNSRKTENKGKEKKNVTAAASSVKVFLVGMKTADFIRRHAKLRMALQELLTGKSVSISANQLPQGRRCRVGLD